jgi:hypothetical protein
MESLDSRMQEAAAARGEASLIGRAVSWVILKLLGMTLIAVFAGIGFAAFKYFVPDDVVPQPPAPNSPAAVAASPVPPIDYRQHAAAAVSDNVPLPAGIVPLPRLPHAPPLAVATHGPPHRPAAHASGSQR